MSTHNRTARSRAPVPAQQLRELATRLLQSFMHDQQDIAALEKCLDAEKQAFEQNNHELINRHTEEKTGLVRSMDERTRQRATWLAQVGFTAQPEHWLATLQSLENSTSIQLLASWEQLSASLQQCQDKMLVNEKILSGMQRSVARFLNILRGQTSASQTYDASGKAQQYADNRPIVKA